MDFDGTLVGIVERPDAVIADDALRDLLAGLCAVLFGRVVIVSGRSLAQLDLGRSADPQPATLIRAHGEGLC